MRTEIHIEKRAALIRAGAYVIFGLSNTPHFAGKILIAFPKYGDGILRAALWDFTNRRDVQNGKCDGFGCDKTSEALDGMKFGYGDREFTIKGGTGMSEVERQFAERGFMLQWVV